MRRVGKSLDLAVGIGDLGQVAAGLRERPGARTYDDRAGAERRGLAVNGGLAGERRPRVSIAHRGEPVGADPVGLQAGAAEVDLGAVGGGVGKCPVMGPDTFSLPFSLSPAPASQSPATRCTRTLVATQPLLGSATGSARAASSSCSTSCPITWGSVIPGSKTIPTTS